MTPEQIDEFKNWGVPLPTREAHGTESGISGQMERPQFSNWRLEGNILKADTQFGEFGHPISPDYILDGTDENGLPKLRKIAIK